MNTRDSTDGRRRTNVTNGAEPTISRSDRDALLKYDRGRVKARKEDAEAYGAHLIAQFEEQLAREYSFDEDATWKAAAESADEAVKAAQRKIAGRCAELGIPRWAWPELSDPYWYRRGESAVKERRAELRKVAQSRAAALVKATKARIERDSIEFQGKLLAGALTSEAARALLDKLPAVESLMPPLDIAEFKVLGNGSNSALEEDDL
jgi:hypothetical protein